MAVCFRSCTFEKQYHIALSDQVERLRGSALKESREKEFLGHQNGEVELFTKEQLGEQIHDERREEENVKEIDEKNSTFPPPPLPSLSALSLESHKQNGRFVLRCRKKPQQDLYYVQTYREDGRLKGNLVVARDEFEAPAASFRQWRRR